MTKQDKVAKVMHEWKAGTLTSNGKQVTDYDQAVAIALSEAGLSKYDKGGDIEDADNFIENVKEMHESIDYVVLKDGTKVNGYDLMEKGGNMNKYAKGGAVDAPKIYVADLEAYNNGKLVGEWLDLSDFEDGKEVSKEISKLLKKWGAEEYAIHDVENVPSSIYSEYMGEADFDKIIKIYKASKENDLPYEVISEIILQYEPEDLEEWISDHYEGHFDNDTDLAYSVVENVGGVSDLGKKTTEMYFDYEKFGRDLAINDYTEIEDGYYFRTPRYAKGGTTNKRKYAVGGGIEEEVPLRADIDGDIYEVIGVNHKLNKVRAKNFASGKVIEMPINKWYEESFEFGTKAKFKANGREYIGMVTMKNGQKSISLFNDENYSGDAERVIPFNKIDLKTLKPTMEREKFAVGGEIGNTVSFKGDYGTPRSGVIKEKRGSSYIVATDDGDRLVDSYEVISFSETPIAKKKRFGFFEGGGSIESKKQTILDFVNSFPDKPKDWSEATDELPDLHDDIADEYNGKYDFDFNKRSSLNERNLRHKKGIKSLLNKLSDEEISNVYSKWEETLEDKYEGGGDIKNEPKLGDLITNYGKYGSSIIEIDEKFVYWLDNYASKNHCEKSDLVLNNLDDDGDDDGYYEDERNNWICKRKYAGGGEIENKIEKLKKVVSSKMLPESVKAKAQAEIDKLEKELHESKETKAEEKEEHKAGGSESKEDLIKIAKKMATERGLRPTNVIDELDAIRTISSIMANESGREFRYAKVDDLGNNEYTIEISPSTEENNMAGMVLNKYRDGTYEVAEMQAGKDGNFIKVFGEYKNLKPAVAKLLKGNKQKPIKVIDMRSPSEIAKENKMTGESEGERKAGMDEEKDYIEAKTKALEKSLKDKTISETQRKRDEKELALFKGAEAKKPTTTSKKEVVGYAIVDPISGEIVVSKKTIRQLIEASKKLEKTKGFEDMGDLAYEIIKKDDKNVLGDKIESVDIRSLPINKKPTTKKAPVKKAVAKKVEVKKTEPKPKFKVGDVLRRENLKGDGFENVKILAVTGWTGNEHRYDSEFLDEKLNPKNKFATVYDTDLSVIPKPKADHKKLVAKLKAKKGDKEYDNRASINVKTGERYKRSESSDKKREALPLGKRVSEDGNVYYERRLNRADISKKDKFEDGGEVKGSDWGLNLNW